jgi:hypothetical protein
MELEDEIRCGTRANVPHPMRLARGVEDYSMAADLSAERLERAF